MLMLLLKLLIDVDIADEDVDAVAEAYLFLTQPFSFVLVSDCAGRCLLLRRPWQVCTHPTQGPRG